MHDEFCFSPINYRLSLFFCVCLYEKKALTISDNSARNVGNEMFCLLVTMFCFLSIEQAMQLLGSAKFCSSYFCRGLLAEKGEESYDMCIYCMAIARKGVSSRACDALSGGRCSASGTAIAASRLSFRSSFVGSLGLLLLYILTLCGTC